MTRSPIACRIAAVATVLAAVAALAGLFSTGLYRDTPYWVQQARGTDLATLLVAVPVLSIGLWAHRRGAAAGSLAVFAGLLYVVYNYGIFVFSVAMNPLTAMHIAIVGLALWSLILMTRGPELTEAGASVAQGLDWRASGVLLVAVAGLFGPLWVGQIATTTTTGTLAPDLVRAGLSTNPGLCTRPRLLPAPLRGGWHRPPPRQRRRSLRTADAHLGGADGSRGGRRLPVLGCGRR